MGIIIEREIGVIRGRHRSRRRRHKQGVNETGMVKDEV